MFGFGETTTVEDKTETPEEQRRREEEEYPDNLNFKVDQINM